MRSLLVLMLLVPAASAAPVDLYAHVDGVQDLAMNTEVPEGTASVNTGLIQVSGCVDARPVTQITDQTQHTWYGYVNAGRVEYVADEPRIYHQRGIHRDMHLLAEPVAHVFIGIEADGGSPIVPEMVLQITLREGDDVSVGNEAFNTGELIAQAAVGPVTLSPAVSGPRVSHHDVDGVHVYGFEVPLPLQKATVNGSESFNMRIDAFVEEPLCGEQYTNPFKMWLHQSPGLHNRLSLDVAAPVYFLSVHPQFVNDDLVFHVLADSVFGDYDLGSGPRVVFQEEPAGWTQVAVTQRICHCSDPEDLAWKGAYVWDRDQAEPGTYAFQVIAENLQGTASATLNGTLDYDGTTMMMCIEGQCLRPDSTDQKAPGAPLALLFVALLALARRPKSP